MKLSALGYTQVLEDYRIANKLTDFVVGRVIAEHKERYVVKTAEQEYEAEILGNLRYSAQSRADFPAVGDWVSLMTYEENKALIHTIFPRKSVIARQAVGSKGEKQIIGSNIDYAFIVQAVDRDFSLNRFERYLTLCYEGKVIPILLLNKTDLISEEKKAELKQQILKRFPKVDCHFISNKSQAGIENLAQQMEAEKTYCLLGSSGVGKSTLLNSLSGEQIMKTGAISAFSERGQHVTTHRALKILPNGALMLDNPGMREVGVADAEAGLAITFDALYELAQDCKYKDCSHTVEEGCALIAAVESGDLERAIYDNFIKMKKENFHFEATVAEKRKKAKDFGKMVKQVKKHKKKRL